MNELTKEQLDEILSALSAGFAAVAAAIESLASSERVVFNTKNLAGDSLTFRASSLEGLEGQLDDLEGEEIRKQHIASFNVLFKADATNGANVDEAMGRDEGAASEDEELAYKLLGGQVRGAAAGKASKSGARANDAPSCPECGGEVWDNRSKITKYGGDGSWSDAAPPFRCKDRDGCDTPIDLDGKVFKFQGRRRRGGSRSA